MPQHRSSNKAFAVAQPFSYKDEESFEPETIEQELEQTAAVMRSMHAQARKIADRLRHDDQLHRLGMQIVMLIEDLELFFKNTRRR